MNTARDPPTGPQHAVQLSVIVPVYGCAGTLVELYRRLTAVLRPAVRSYEIVFVDDHAPDGAWAVLQSMAANDRRVVAIRMVRNVGQQLAIAVGLKQCCGAHAVIMDCDLQDPPEAIPALYAAAQRGFDIVLAKRRGRHRPRIREVITRVSLAVLGLLSLTRYDAELGTFSLVSRAAIQRFVALPQRGGPHVIILLELGMGVATIEYERHARRVSRSSFGFGRLIVHAISAFLFVTVRPLFAPRRLEDLIEHRLNGSGTAAPEPRRQH